MKKFDGDRNCPKCGGYATRKYDNNFGRDTIVRTCNGCGYVWNELPLDAEE